MSSSLRLSAASLLRRKSSSRSHQRSGSEEGGSLYDVGYTGDGDDTEQSSSHDVGSDEEVHQYDDEDDDLEHTLNSEGFQLVREEQLGSAHKGTPSPVSSPNPLQSELINEIHAVRSVESTGSISRNGTYNYGNKSKNAAGQGRLFGSVRTRATPRFGKVFQGNGDSPRGARTSTDRKGPTRLLRQDSSRSARSRTGTTLTARAGRTPSLFMSKKASSSSDSRWGSEDGQVPIDLDDVELDPEGCREYLEGLKSELALQLEITKLELLASLVPARVIRHHMYQKHSKRVFSENFDGAALFADISGFSNLAERLVKEISHEAYAAENLSRYIGASLEQMVRIICNRGGDVVKFAGDAILAIFPAESFDNSLEDATLCAAQVALDLTSFKFTVVGASGVQLSVHCGVGTGTIVSYHVHGENDRWEYVATGAPVDQISSTEPEAEAGQTVVSQEVFELIGDFLDGERLESGNLLLTDVICEEFGEKELIFTELNEFTARNKIQYKRLQQLLQCYVPAPAINVIEGGNGIWSGELRICSTIFCRLVGLEFKGGESDLDTVQRAFEVVHKHVEVFEGTLLRFIVDDKGASVLSAFGLPPLKHENDAVRAIKCSMAIQTELRTMQTRQSDWQVGCSIGITTGEVFCGTVGGSVRCEYTLHGVKVNLAARLMVAAGKTIYCDEQTYNESRKVIKFGYPRSINVKGHQGKIQVFKPRQQKLIVSIFDQKEGNSNMGRQIGRREEKMRIKRTLNYVLSPSCQSTGILVITGDAGIGKTKMCQYAIEKTKENPWMTLFARGDDTESHNRFVIWKSLFTQLLQNFAGERRLSRMSNEERLGLLSSRLPSEDIFNFGSEQASARSRTGTIPREDSYDRETSSHSGKVNHTTAMLRGMTRFPSMRDRNESINDFESDADGSEQGGTARGTQLSDLSGGHEMPNVIREYAPLLRHIVPDFFDLGRAKEGDGITGAPAADNNYVYVIKLIVEIFAKAIRDLQHADEYFDTSHHGIAANNNVVRFCMIVENVQWIDQLSMEALYRLALRNDPMALILSARDDMFASLQTPAGDSVGDWYTKLCSLSNAQKLELKPLSKHEITDCIKLWTKTNAPPLGRLTTIVYDKSQGQPFFAYELINFMRESDMISIRQIDSNTSVCELNRGVQEEDMGLPSTISSLMTSRIDRIPAGEQLTLKVAAVIGTEFKMHELASVLLNYKGDEEDESPVLEDFDMSSRHYQSSHDSETIGNRDSNRSRSLRTSPVRSRSTRHVESDAGAPANGDGNDKRNSGPGRSVTSLLKERTEENSSRPLSKRSLAASSGDGRYTQGGFESVSSRPLNKPAAAAAAGDVREIYKLLDENINRLISRGFLVREEEDVGDASQIRFSSIMLRESAYGLLLFGMRKALHLQVAEFLEERYGDYLQPVYGMLAHHYVCAEVPEKAIYYLEIAGNDALEIHAMQSVWVCFTRLLQIVEKYDQPVSEWRRVSWYRKVAEAYMYYGRSDAAEDSLIEALDILSLNATVSVEHETPNRSTVATTHSTRYSRSLSFSLLGEALVQKIHRLSGASDGATSSSRDAQARTLSVVDMPLAGSSELRADPPAHMSMLHSPRSPASSVNDDDGRQRILVSRATSSFNSEANEGNLMMPHTLTAAEMSSNNGWGSQRGAAQSDQSVHGTLNRGAYRTKFVRNQQPNNMNRRGALIGRSSVTGSMSPVDDLLEQIGEMLDSDPETSKTPSSSHRIFSFWANRRRKKTMRSNLKKRRANLEKNKSSYSRVEDKPAFKEVLGDSFNNVEIFLEASIIYQRLASLIMDQTGPVAMERRFNALTLAKEAYRCSLHRPAQAAERKYYASGESNVILDLNDHKIENRALDPRAASLDQLADCYMGQAIFFAGVPYTWAREIADNYAEKAMEFYPNVRNSSLRGTIAAHYGEYLITVSRFQEASRYLKNAAWMLSFLGFQNEMLSTLELQIVLKLFSGRDASQLHELGRKLYEEGTGIQCVHTLCSLTELLYGSYVQSVVFLDPVVQISLDFLSELEEWSVQCRLNLQNICKITGDNLSVTRNVSGTVDALVSMALLMQRYYGHHMLALVVARVAANFCAVLHNQDGSNHQQLSIVDFHICVAIFQAFAESFTPFKDVDWNLDGNDSPNAVAQPRYGKALCGTLDSIANARSSVPTDHGARYKDQAHRSLMMASGMSLGGLSKSSKSTTSSQANKPSHLNTDDEVLRHLGENDSYEAHLLQQLKPQWRKIGNLKLARKHSIPSLRMLLDIIQHYADVFKVCRPAATYCTAIFNAVKAGKHNPRSLNLLEKAAEQASEQGQQRIKLYALLEFALAKRREQLLEQLSIKFRNMRSMYQVRKIEFYLQ